MIQCDLQFEILSRRAKMKSHEINSTKRRLGVWHFCDHFNSNKTKFHCSARCSGAVPFAKRIIRIYAHKILTRLISNHSDIRAHFIARFDCANFKLLLSAQTKRLVQIKFRHIYRSLRYVNLKPRSRPPTLYLGSETPHLDKITTFT